LPQEEPNEGPWEITPDGAANWDDGVEEDPSFKLLNEGPWEITPDGAAGWDDGVEEDPSFKLFELAFSPLEVKLPTVICK